MPERIRVVINGQDVNVPDGCTVAAALMSAGEPASRHSVSGEPRGPLCGMGICFECRVTVDGVEHSRGCQTLCRPGMRIETT